MSAQRAEGVVTILHTDDDSEDTQVLNHSVLAAVDSSIRAAHWLTEADQGAVTLARTYAAAIDSALAEHGRAKDVDGRGGWALVSKLVSGAGPNLQKTLHSLGLTPESRGDLERTPDVDDEDPLADFARAAQEAMGRTSA